MQTPFANLTAEQLSDLSPSELAGAASPQVEQGTLVMPFRTLAPQDEPEVVQAAVIARLAAKPQPRRVLVPPPAPPAEKAANRKGRAKLIDTTDITQLPVIARRCTRAYLLSDGEYERISKPASLAIVKYLEFLGKPVDKVNLSIAADGVEVLVFG